MFLNAFQRFLSLHCVEIHLVIHAPPQNHTISPRIRTIPRNPCHAPAESIPSPPGTDDFRTLSAIYSQLGNAYFYMGDYVKAMQYHKHDLTLARTMADRLGEAKASGNLGNTLKVMGKLL